MRILSGNMIKWIAAVFMVVDHVGLFLFPGLPWLRVIGRLAFPLFAYMIAEGCRYTKNPLRYFLCMAAFGIVCQGFYTVFSPSQANNFCVFITFAFSIGIAQTLALVKRALLFSYSWEKKLVAFLLLALAFGVTLLFHHLFYLDYSIYGCLLPVAATLPHAPQGAPEGVRRRDTRLMSLVCFSIALLPLCLYYGGRQWWCYLSLPLLLLYSGKRGRHKQKLFFYLFYPAHLAILYGISQLIR